MFGEIKEIGKPFGDISNQLMGPNIKLLESGINKSFEVLRKRANLFYEALVEKTPWVIQTEKAINNFVRSLSDIKEIEGVYLSLREARGRTFSGYITDVLVTVLDANREMELKIYRAFGEMLNRSDQTLLFDMHLSKLKNRNPKEVIPEGFWCYEC